MLLFFRSRGSYLGNKVLFDIFAGSGWNVGCEKAGMVILGYISREII